MIDYPTTITVGEGSDAYSSTTWYSESYTVCSTSGGDSGPIVSGEESLGGCKCESGKNVSIIDNEQIQIDIWEDQIDDSQLKPCLKTILTDVKNISQGSVGQIIQKFAGSIPGWNWELKDGVLTGGTGETDPPANYNKSTGTVTTTFDTQAWLNASDLENSRHDCSRIDRERHPRKLKNTKRKKCRTLIK
ncbi:MAG: hypothetical protein KatS3mg032_1547 [Cyclobacteriaceae bacterium]|nr:MAG: hypothetical protein KatS3mg032_1547 [Cyclobacteriaceae bacterium]